MSTVLNTTALNYHLESVINNASTRVLLISPYLRLNDRIKELIEDKNRMKIDIRFVYGKASINQKDFEWLKSLSYVRLSFCQNLHAKLYANEQQCIISSMNLYEFSQVNNLELGISLTAQDDAEAYSAAMNEAQRILRISVEDNLPGVDVPAVATTRPPEVVSPTPAVEVPASAEASTQTNDEEHTQSDDVRRMTSSNLAKELKISTKVFYEKLLGKGFISESAKGFELTEAGKNAGAQTRPNRYKKGETYILWPCDMALD